MVFISLVLWFIEKGVRLVKSPPDITSRGDNNTNTNKPALQMQETQVSLLSFFVGFEVLGCGFVVCSTAKPKDLQPETYNQKPITSNHHIILFRTAVSVLRQLQRSP